MPQTMNDIKNKISSTQNMSKITKAMQMVSASKLNKSEIKVKNHQNYIKTLETILDHIIMSISVDEHVLFKPKTETKCTAYLVITTDRGLVGGYNHNVLKRLQAEINERKRETYKLYMVGSKAFDYARRWKISVNNDYMFVPDDIVYVDVVGIVSKVIKAYLNGEVNEVVIVYHHYLSKLFQDPVTKCVLPLTKKKSKKAVKKDYIFRPNQEELIQTVLLNYLSGEIYGLILNAKLSEHASRMNAMQNATENAMEIINESQLIYNRARQAAITQEINEIVAGAIGLKS
jgi:F-type H+-transporting ATPase subunit gamma